MTTLLTVVLALSATVLNIAGTAILAASAIQALATALRTTAATEAPTLDANGLAKVLEMLSKLPQWLLAIMIGDVQLWLAMRTWAGQSWWSF